MHTLTERFPRSTQQRLQPVPAEAKTNRDLFSRNAIQVMPLHSLTRATL
jgi:hypothetical protein